MAEEFKRIMEFFSMDPKDKENKLQDVFEDSVEYFERFKHIMINGTPEEKQQAVENVMAMKKRIEEETHKICEKTGLSEKQLGEFSNNPENFAPDQWDAIEHAKKKLEKGADEIREVVSPETPAKPTQEKESPKKKRPKKPKGWGKV